MFARLLYTRSEAAELLAVSLRKLDELIAAGTLAAVRLDRRPRIAAAELDRYIASLSSPAPADGHS